MSADKRRRGFTLIELMIVVAVIGILAAIVVPSYNDSVLKGKRGQGRAALAELLQQEERYLTQRNCYLAFSVNASGEAVPAASCGVTPATVPFKTHSGDNPANAAYSLSAQACPDPGGGADLALTDCVQVTATPLRPDEAAGALVMTSTGAKSCTGTRSADPKVCWP